MEPCGGRHAGERSARQRQRPRPGGVPKSQQDEARGTSTGPFYSNATNRIKKPTRRSTRLGRQLEQRSCTHRRTLFPGGNLPAGSDQAPPRHTEHSAYRCYLPVLTGFTDIRCAGPSHLRHLTGPGPKRKRPRVGVRPRYSGLRVQGTATSPSSTTKLSRDLPARCCPCHVPGLAPASPPCHNGAPPTHGGYEPLASLLKRSLMMSRRRRFDTAYCPFSPGCRETGPTKAGDPHIHQRNNMAERAGFEPARQRASAYPLSRRAP